MDQGYRQGDDVLVEKEWIKQNLIATLYVSRTLHDHVCFHPSRGGLRARYAASIIDNNVRFDEGKKRLRIWRV
jgi:hypothetical protein